MRDLIATLTRSTARTEKSQACTKMSGYSASNGNTVFPVPHPTCRCQNHQYSEAVHQLPTLQPAKNLVHPERRIQLQLVTIMQTTGSCAYLQNHSLAAGGFLLVNLQIITTSGIRRRTVSINWAKTIRLHQPLK